MHIAVNRSILFAILRACLIYRILDSRQTTAKEWTCHDGYSIPNEWKCDDVNDCLDGSDEFPANCANKTCEEVQFRCDNTRCIDRSYVCDGEPDCMDGDFSDEENCECQSSEFKCKTGGDCLQKVWLCDWERDCQDGSDEWDCPCKDDAYGCKVRGIMFCLKNSTKCDGITHCDGGEDEENCDHIILEEDGDFTCGPTRFKCRTGNECVLWKSVCDGYSDCRDKSDEGGLCHANECGLEKSSGLVKRAKPRVACEKYCHETPNGAQCSCDTGFRLSKNGTHCLDEDECEEMMSDRIHNHEKMSKLYVWGLPSVCNQKCVNLAGGFQCACVDGYRLEDDGFTCKALGTYNPELYVGVDDEIRVSSLRDPGDRTSYYNTVYKSRDPDETIVDIDIIVGTSSIFWIEKKSARLLMMKDEIITQLPTDFTPEALSVDWITGNIFVATTKHPNQIQDYPAIVLLSLPNDNSLEKNNIENVVTPRAVEILVTGLKRPSAIALFPSKGILVVADKGDLHANNGRRIFVADMNGGNIRNLVTGNMLTPHDVIIDEVQNSVIWASANEDPDDALVESIRLDGTQRGVIMSREVNRFPLGSVSIDFFEDRLFVSDRLAREVRSWKISEIALYGKQNAMYGSEGVIKQDHKTRLGAIRIAHPILQRPVKDGNLCKTYGCSYACVTLPTKELHLEDLLQTVKLKAKCLCPNTHRLSKDRKTCIEEILPIHGGAETVTALLDSLSPFAVAGSEELGHKSTKVTCPNPGRLKNAKKASFSKPQYSVGDRVAVLCEDGYSLKKGKFKTRIACMSNGKWSDLPPTCVPTNKISTVSAAQGETTQQPGISEPNSNRAMQSKFIQALCVSLNCGPWGHCRKNDTDYVCHCPHGETLSQLPRCLPPNPDSTTQNITDSPRSGRPTSSRSTGLMAAVIVFATILLVVFVIFAWRCVRKKRYSVDLRYFRGNKRRVPVDSRESVFVDHLTGGRTTSITNPNYSSPSKRRRLPRPKLCDDDSGIQQSFGSESSSSTTSDSSASERNLKSPVEDSERPTTSAPLLNQVIPKDDEVSMGDVSIGSSTIAGKAGLGERLGQLFKMRKTESRECMLPKRKLTKS